MSKASKLVGTKILVILGLAFVAFGLTLGLTTYVVSAWYIYPGLDNGASWGQLKRSRGIFQECYSVSTAPFTVLPPYILKYSCVDIDVGQYTNQIGAGGDKNYMMIIRLRQSQLILHGISLVFALVIMMVGMGVMFKWFAAEIDSNYYIQWRLALGLLSLLTFFLMAASPSLGIAIIYVESFSNYATPYLPYIQSYNNNIWPAWGSMFITAWVSTGLYLIATLFLLISVCLGSRLEKEKYAPQTLSVDNPAFYCDDGKTNPNIFFTPSTGYTFGTNYESKTPNDTLSPGLLPRYTVDAK